MSTGDWIFAYGLFGIFLTMILYVAFGQITVRKLRKNPETKNSLGVEFASGWDILNVAGALSTPKWLRKKIASSPLSGLSANYQLLYENTNKFDRLLARVFWVFYVGSVCLILLVILLTSLGFLE